MINRLSIPVLFLIAFPFVLNGQVVINEWMETGEPGVYAIGDLAGPPWLAHKASHEGVICIEKIAGEKTHPLNTSLQAVANDRPEAHEIAHWSQALIEWLEIMKQCGGL